MRSFLAWENFYVIVGSSGAALTGLQFVVMALIADSRQTRSSDGVDAFGTPTIVHFGAVMLIAAVVSAPWEGVAAPAIVLGLSGAAGIAYLSVVTLRAVRQTAYRPVAEDWIWHNILPFATYATVFGGAFVLPRHERGSLFAIGASSLLLLFIGIHNAWDTVTWVALVERNKESTASGATDK